MIFGHLAGGTLQQGKGEAMRAPKSPICPMCGSAFDIEQMDFAMPFRCPACRRYLCVPRSWSIFSALRALFVSGLLCFFLGARGLTLFLAAVLTWIPLGFVLLFWTRHFAPPKLKACPPPDSSSGPLGLGGWRRH
jgi:hypothetical protein